MKRIVVLTAISLATLTGAASAMTEATGVNTATINRYAPDVDVSHLTNAQIRTLLNFIHSGESEGQKRQAVQAYLR